MSGTRTTGTNGASGPTTRMIDWSMSRSTLRWAYEGDPILRRSSGWSSSGKAWFVKQGRVHCETTGGVADVEAGHWVFPPAGPITQAFSADAQVLSVNFDLTWPDGTRVFDVPEPTVFGARQASALMRVSRRLVKVAAHVPTGSVKPAWQISLSKVDARTYFAVTAAFQQFLASYAQLSEAAGIPATSFGAANDHFATALRVLDHWPCDRPLELAEVAAAASISVAHLRRIFIDRLGHTPRTHFDRRRLDFAKRLLTDNDAQIKRVAYLVGFDVPAHFTRWFKRHTGQAPRSFRTAPHTAARPTEKPASARTR